MLGEVVCWKGVINSKPELYVERCGSLLWSCFLLSEIRNSSPFVVMCCQKHEGAGSNLTLKRGHSTFCAVDCPLVEVIGIVIAASRNHGYHSGAGCAKHLTSTCTGQHAPNLPNNPDLTPLKPPLSWAARHEAQEGGNEHDEACRDDLVEALVDLVGLRAGVSGRI